MSSQVRLPRSGGGKHRPLLAQALFQHTTDAVLVIDRNDKVGALNPAFMTLYGWTLADFAGRSFMDVTGWERDPLSWNCVWTGDSITEVERNRTRKNASVVEVLVSRFPLRDESGQITSVLEISRDISAQKQSARKLMETQALYHLITTHMSDIVGLIGCDGIVQYTTPSAYEVIGQHAETHVGEQIFDFVHRDDLPRVKDTFNYMMKEKINVQTEFRFRHADGRFIHLDVKGVPVIDELGNVVSVLAAGRDVSDRKRTEELLIHAEQLSAIGQLAASLAHEIRNPLTTIQGFLQLFRRRWPEANYQLALVLSELQRIDTIVSEVLYLAKPQPTWMEEFRVVELLQDVVSMMEPQALMQGVEMNFRTVMDGDTEDGNANPYNQMTVCDGKKVKQVFINLLKNSMEAMPTGGLLDIELTFLRGEVVVFIRDEGTGIPPHLVGQLGTPFVTTKANGTGLGLTVSTKIIHDHGGSIHIRNRDTHGAEVEVRLPTKVSNQV